MSELYISHDGEPPIAELEPLPAWDLTRGDQVQRRWVGSRERIKAKRAEIILAGATSVRVSDGPNGIGLTLTADFAGVYNPVTGGIDSTQSVVITEWTSEPAVFSNSIWNLPVIVQQFDRLGTDDIGLANARKLRNYIDALVRGDSTVPDPADPKGVKTLPLTPTILLGIVATAGLNVEVFRKFLRDLLRGTTSYTPASWTLRRSRRIPGAVAFTESSVNVGRWLTYGALVGEGFSAEKLRTAIPLNGFWLKQHPTDRPAGDGFREVVTDYIWGEAFSDLIFDQPITG
ncbi:MAG: hypothetical protein U1G08_19970 [Verrucomicrobiota bacterium]